MGQTGSGRFVVGLWSVVGPGLVCGALGVMVRSVRVLLVVGVGCVRDVFRYCVGGVLALWR